MKYKFMLFSPWLLKSPETARKRPGKVEVLFEEVLALLRHSWMQRVQGPQGSKGPNNQVLGFRIVVMQVRILESICYWILGPMGGLPQPQITYLFQDLYKEIIVRNPKKVGYSGLRQGLDEVCVLLKRFGFQRLGLRRSSCFAKAVCSFRVQSSR